MIKTSALRDLWRNLGPKGQLGLAASGLLVIVTMFFLYRTAAKPSYTALLTGLDPTESASIDPKPVEPELPEAEPDC